MHMLYCVFHSYGDVKIHFLCRTIRFAQTGIKRCWEGDQELPVALQGSNANQQKCKHNASQGMLHVIFRADVLGHSTLYGYEYSLQMVRDVEARPQKTLSNSEKHGWCVHDVSCHLHPMQLSPDSGPEGYSTQSIALV